MRKNCLSTPPAWAFPDLEYADNSATNWGGSINRVESSNRVDSNMKRGSTSSQGAPSLRAANEPPVALFCLTEIVDNPLEWVVEGVIPRGELTLITGEAGVGKSAFLTGMIANVTRGTLGPRGALWQEDALRLLDPDWYGSGGVSEVDRLENRHQTSAGRSAVERGAVRPHDTGQRRGPYAIDRAPVEPNPVEPTPAAVVAFFTANMLADSVRPQLIEAGADLAKVYALCYLEDPVQLVGDTRRVHDKHFKTIISGRDFITSTIPILAPHLGPSSVLFSLVEDYW